MRPLFLFLLTAIILPLHVSAAKAQEVLQCGTPSVVHVDPGQFTYCDIYSRQIAYKHNRDAFIEELRTRQRNYPVARSLAYENYKANLEKVYEAEHEKEARIKFEQEEAERAANTPPESYGPPSPPSGEL